MGSPFPGVDPYLESQRYWPDFHSRFVNCWCEAISDALPSQYEARMDERVQIVGLDPRGDRVYLPDVAVLQQPAGSQAGRQAAPVDAASAGAVTVEFPLMEEVRESFIHIVHRPERTLVAVLELLSPANKAEPGRGQYLGKRVELLSQPVHLVELDLLVGGDRLPMRRALPPGDFYAMVSRSERRRVAQVWAWTVRNPLPAIPIPLLKPDKDLVIDLEPVFSTAYERGRYARSIDYKAKLSVPLDEGSMAWATGIGAEYAGKA